MIERFLYTALVQGRDAITNDLTLLEPMFGDNYGLNNEEVATIKTYWEQHPPKVVHGYALATHTFPLWSIVLGAENEQEKFIGNEAGVCLDPDDPDYLADLKSTIWKHSYRILIYAQHPDITLYYYEIAKRIILLANDYFVEQNVAEIDLAGRDLIPDPKYLPEHLFVREMTFTCERELLQVDRDSRLSKAFAVSGIHVDKSGSPSDVGGVETRVTPYTE